MGRHKKVNEKEMDQLTKDSIAAQKAGMTYGRYKALQPVKVKPRTEQPEIVTDRPTCIVCGKPLPEFSRRKLYCSDECSERARMKDWRSVYGQV